MDGLERQHLPRQIQARHCVSKAGVTVHTKHAFSDLFCTPPQRKPEGKATGDILKHLLLSTQQPGTDPAADALGHPHHVWGVLRWERADCDVLVQGKRRQDGVQRGQRQHQRRPANGGHSHSAPMHTRVEIFVRRKKR